MDTETDFGLEAKKLEAILRASAEGSLEDLDRLLFKEKGIDILGVCKDESGRTPLHLAAANGHQECVESLLQAGHAWNSVDDSYVSAGEMAKQNGHDAIYEMLLQAGIRTELLLSLMEGQEDEEDEEDEVVEFDEEGNPIGVVGVQSASSSAAVSNADYLAMPLHYSDDGTKLLDEEKNAVMMDWEGPLMQEHAKILCERPGKGELHILNVGFGLGLIDEAIQAYKPARHTIVEAHPDVYAKMLRDGWAQRPGVTILFGRWQDVLKRGDFETYDGIFWDTFGEHYRDQKIFHDAIPLLLNPDGIFSFFNGLGGTNFFFHDVYCKIVQLEFEEIGFSVQFIPIAMDPNASQIWDGVKRRYWSLKTYNLPIIQAVSYDEGNWQDQEEPAEEPQQSSAPL
jgi:protein arginine N-methyltransferase 2